MKIICWVIFQFILVNEVHTVCNPPPSLTDCLFPVPHAYNVLDNATIEAVKYSIVYKSCNETVVVGHKAKGRISVNVTGLSHLDLTLRASYNGCIVPNTAIPNVHCSTPQVDKENLLSRTCTVHNMTLLNNDTVMDYILYSTKHHVSICTTSIYPSIHLYVEEKPLSVEIHNYSINYTLGISFLFSSTAADTRIICKIFANDEPNSSYIFETKDCDNSTIVPPHVFKNHTGTYTLIAQTIKTVARGEKRNFTFTLEKAAIYSEIDDITVLTIRDRFLFILDVKVDRNQNLTIPNYVVIYSNCFISPKFEEFVLHDLGELIYRYYLEVKERFCFFSIEDSGGNNRTYSSNISTTYTQAVFLSVVKGGYVSFSCELLSHTSAAGCQLVATPLSNHSNQTVLNSTANGGSSMILHGGTMGPLESGPYSLIVYDLVNKSPEYRESVYEMTVTVPTPSSRDTTSVTISAPFVTSTVLHTTTVTVPTPFATIEEQQPTSEVSNYNIIKGVAVALGLSCVCLILFLIVALTFIGILLKRKKKVLLEIRGVLDSPDEEPLVQPTGPPVEVTEPTDSHDDQLILPNSTKPALANEQGNEESGWLVPPQPDGESGTVVPQPIMETGDTGDNSGRKVIYPQDKPGAKPLDSEENKDAVFSHMDPSTEFYTDTGLQQSTGETTTAKNDYVGQSQLQPAMTTTTGTDNEMAPLMKKRII